MLPSNQLLYSLLANGYHINLTYLSELSTKTISEPKVQETSTTEIIRYIQLNQNNEEKSVKNYKIEINKRFGMPLFIPLIGLVICFLLPLGC